MLLLKEIDHLVLRVRDFQTMEDFYCNIIGCSLKRRRPGLVQLQAGASVIYLTAAEETTGHAGGDETHNLDHFCLSVLDFDLDTILKDMEARGVTIASVTRRGSIFLRDPEGNRVELIGDKRYEAP